MLGYCAIGDAVITKGYNLMDECMDDIEVLMPNIDKANPGLREKMLERLK